MNAIKSDIVTIFTTTSSHNRLPIKKTKKQVKEKEKDLEPHALKLCQDYLTNYNFKSDSCENML
jgi:hypothetical protein